MKILPVIHLHPERPTALALLNAQVASRLGCAGVFLISNDGQDSDVIPAALEVKDRFPELRVGVNLLEYSAEYALARSREAGLDMTWSDSADIHGSAAGPVALALQRLLASGPSHEFFGGVAFKYRREDPDPDAAARKAVELGMIPTTSGSGTGIAAPLAKIQLMKGAVGDGPLALASGLTPDNIAGFRGLITHALVATGIGSDFYNIDPDKLAALIQNAG